VKFPRSTLYARGQLQDFLVEDLRSNCRVDYFGTNRTQVRMKVRFFCAISFNASC